MNRIINGCTTDSEINRLSFEDRGVHEWYRFVLSFPAHLVRNYLERFAVDATHRVLDPFCGTGTVLVECKKLGIASEGVEANPMAHFATAVKTDWRPDPDRLIEHARQIGDNALYLLKQDGIEDTALFASLQYGPQSLRTLSEEETALLLTNSISPLPLHKTLILLECIKNNFNEEFSNHEMLALINSTVFSNSNLRFGPEIGVGTIKVDAPVVSTWLKNVRTIAEDLRLLKDRANVSAQVHLYDSRNSLSFLKPASIDAVITSPPYPNEKDYTRTTRLEAVLLGFIHNKADLQMLKKTLLCSNTRTVYRGDTDEAWIKDYPEIRELAEVIEARRIELGKTSGFEKLYARVTKQYFGGMARHLAFLRTVLRPGAHLAYVVGDQASYFRVLIPTGKLLAGIARSLGYESLGRELFRNRFATVTKEQLREEVVILRWPGTQNSRPRNIFGGVRLSSLFPEEETSPTDGAMKTASNDSNHESAFEENAVILSSPSTRKLNRYQKLVEHIFHSRYQEGAFQVEFEREDLESAAQILDIKLPKNLGDVIYSFRYRVALPESIREKAPAGMEWTISPAGRSRYCFVAKEILYIEPHPLMAEIKIPDATPGIVIRYAQGDEQALLAKLRYNRLIDIFTRVTCYSLQNHLRTFISGIGQVETDELYVGVDRNGVQYVFPVQAKGGKDRIGITQIEQDIALCELKFPQLVCRPIAAQFIEENRIALFEFTQEDNGVRLHQEKHYKLVPPEKMTDEDLLHYRRSTADTDKG